MDVETGCALRYTFWGSLMAALFAGVADCSLSISTFSPPVVNAMAGSNVILNISFSGATNPLVQWTQNNVPVVIWTVNSTNAPMIYDQNHVLGIVSNGSLTFQNVQVSYSGNYTATIVMVGMGEASATFQLRVFGYPACAVQAINGIQKLQYSCQMMGGSPDAQLSFPALSNSTSKNESLSVTVAASQSLNGKPITCLVTNIPFQLNCSVTARGPVNFLPMVTTTADSSGNMVVTINSNSSAVPPPNLIWSKDGQILTSGGQYQIINSTSVLTIQNFSVSSNLGNYTSSGQNPLGNQSTNVQLLGPTISDFGAFLNQAGTVVTLTWDCPDTSIITAFNIQMKGPNVTVSTSGNRRRKRATEDFRTISIKPASARSQDLSALNPQTTYWFRVVPVAGNTNGAPSTQLKVGPASTGLSQGAIIGLAVGIPCGVILLIIIILLIVCCVCSRRRRQEPRYPVTRNTAKVEKTQPNPPHTLLTREMRSTNQPPGYNIQAASERSSPLPSTLTLETRMATAV